MRQGLRRRAVPAPAQHRHSTYTFDAPIRGLIRNENLASGRKGGARLLENFFPTTTGIRLRKGADKHATIGAGAAVTALFEYAGGSTREFFAATPTAIYDVTAPADVDVSPTAAVGSLTGGEWSTQNFTTTGGNFLWGVNGADDGLLYDGTSWTAINTGSSPPVTGVATSALSFVWSHKNRLWFVQGGTMDAWYLPTDSVSGAATKFSLAGVFRRGGSLLFGGTWSADSGDGMDDRQVFVSTEGEVALYEGTDPSSASTWALVSRFDIGRPLGAKATMTAGGDLLIATEIGLIPLSKAMVTDVAALDVASVAFNIDPLWREDAAARTSNAWQIAKWSAGNMAIVSLPRDDSADPKRCFVVNLLTGAWSVFTGWDTRSVVIFDGAPYYGTADGKVMAAEQGGLDDGEPFTGVYVGLFDGLRAPAVRKTVLMARATFLAGQAFNPSVTVATDYAIDLPPAPDAAAVVATSLWGTAVWGTAVWGGVLERTAQTKWQGVSRSGFAIAPALQITSADELDLDVELVSIDVTFAMGAVVVG